MYAPRIWVRIYRRTLTDDEVKLLADVKKP